MDHYLAKYGYAALILILLCSVASADPLPARKVMNCSIPPSCGDVNLNFANLWNVCGTKIDATNAPTLFSKIAGGDITGASGMRCLGCGVVLGRNSTSPISAAGTLILDHDAARLEIASGTGNIGRIDFSTTPAAYQWTLQRTAANYFDINGPAAGYIVLHNPVAFSDEAQVVLTSFRVEIGAVATGATAPKKIAPIPYAAKKVGGTWKMRAIILTVGGDATSDWSGSYDFFKSTDAVAATAVTGTQWDGNVAQFYVSEWKTMTAPVATDKAVAIEFTNGAGVNYTAVTVEIEHNMIGIGSEFEN